ncbi:MAG TPA: chondroitinase family polysaccharide lyase [Chthoniobacteraceae bacterium]|jgi:chondroitin-sulfate-ABC endolyase/exolyase|nr:chondroitinase family polysaccharide lyase [Chthoniobacteraceae bacterium]
MLMHHRLIGISRTRFSKIWFVLLALILGHCTAETLDSFENGVPAYISADPGSALSISSEHSIIGDSSLCWNWKAGSVLNFAQPIVVKDGSVAGMPASTTFAFWVYNETPRQDAIRVEFMHGGSVSGYFDFRLGFRGWRTAWVVLKRDLQACNSREFDGFRICAPTSGPGGRLFLDAITPDKMVDTRYATSDDQVTVKDAGFDKHWTASRKIMDLKTDGLPVPSDSDLAGVETVMGKIDRSTLLPRIKVTDAVMAQMRAGFAEFQVRHNPDGTIRGMYVPLPSEGVIFPADFFAARMGHTDIRTAGKLLLQMAAAWHAGNSSQRAEIEKMYLDLNADLLDQGWAVGHGRGTHHHVGYETREYYVANYFMRDVLARAGLLKPTLEAMEWFSNARRCLQPAGAIEECNLDELHTESVGQLLTLLMTPDPIERGRLVRAYASYLSAMIALQRDDTSDGFKRDGTAFHHGGDYPAYAIGAYEMGSDLFHWFAGTPFRLSSASYRNFLRAMMATRIYCNRLDWTNNVSGRHPFDGSIESLKNAFLDMALAGTPDGTSPINADAAAAWLRLWGRAGAIPASLASAGVPPEPDPSGFWVFNYAAHAVLRRSNWMVSIKGYDKYVWASEIYAANNRFGRYQSNGTVEILGPGGRISSGFGEDGWDWNRPPGGTIVHLPFDQLNSPRAGTTMYTSPEVFAGATSLDGSNGVFGMILNEAAPFYGNKLRAEKSVFCFDNRVVCLGSDISSVNRSYPVETSIFQNRLPSPADATYSSAAGGAVTGFPFASTASGSSGPQLLGDAFGNSYWLADGQDIHFSRMMQTSPNGSTLRPASGNFASAWINHGIAPKNGGYIYAILVGTPFQDAKPFADAMTDPSRAPIIILRRDSSAHAVYDRATGIFGYAAFTAANFANGPLMSVDRPSLLMIAESPGGLKVSACDPDLKFPLKKDAPKSNTETDLDASGTPVPEPPSIFHLFLKGRYRLAGDGGVRLLQESATETEVEVSCSHAQPVEFQLTR